MNDTEHNTQQTQTPEVPQETSATVETYSKEDLTSAVEKARKQEKDKLYSRLTEMDAKSTDYAEKLSKTTEMLESLVQERDQTRQELEIKKQEELSVEERVAVRLKALEQKEEQMRQQLERVAEEAAFRVRESELKLFKANKVVEANLTLTELVSGNSEQEIMASIEKAKQREDSIFKRAKEQARSELSQNLPKPVPTPVQHSQDSSHLIDPRKKFEMANLSSEDFNRLKADLLAKARQQIS